jgi:PII-like signaling protein
MINLPKKIIQVLRQFEGAFGERVWQLAQGFSKVNHPSTLSVLTHSVAFPIVDT